jgi:hypothetical protein
MFRFDLGTEIVATGTVAALLHLGPTAASWPYCCIMALLQHLAALQHDGRTAVWVRCGDCASWMEIYVGIVWVVDSWVIWFWDGYLVVGPPIFVKTLSMGSQSSILLPSGSMMWTNLPYSYSSISSTIVTPFSLSFFTSPTMF